jgi:hypothetical protein
MLAAVIALLPTLGCGRVAAPEQPDAAIADASTPEAPVTEGGMPDVVSETATQEAAPDAPFDANSCMQDSTEVVCCCDGDIGGQVVCLADGSLGCYGTLGTLNLYFGADCTRPCGPCMLPCPESGTD